MSTVTLEEAQAHLAELIACLPAQQPIVITQNDKPIAQLVAPPADKPQPVFGRCRGMLIVNSEDDDHLKDFAEYMP